MTGLRREEMVIDRTQPVIIHGRGDPPPPLTDDEFARLEARVATFGTESVLSALQDFRQRSLNFFIAAGLWEQDEEAATRAIAKAHQEGGVLGEGEYIYASPHTNRQLAWASLRNLERLVRAELVAL